MRSCWRTCTAFSTGEIDSMANGRSTPSSPVIAVKNPQTIRAKPAAITKLAPSKPRSGRRRRCVGLICSMSSSGGTPSA